MARSRIRKGWQGGGREGGRGRERSGVEGHLVYVLKDSALNVI
jgi:hypothetical protein